jgi:hypothetical protein
VTEALIPSEPIELQAYEATIADGLQTFVDVGEALLAIRDKRLYRESHKAFEDYCRQRWGFNRQRASQLIQAADVSKILDSAGLPAPANDAQARELAPLRDEPERLQEAWLSAIEQTDGKPTATAVREAVTAATREGWLGNLADKLRPLFATADLPLPERILFSVSEPSRRLGCCWTYAEPAQIFISAELVEPLDVAATVVHECLHAALPPNAPSHGPAFKRGMAAIGLEGQAATTNAGPELTGRLNAILATMPPYPHTRLELPPRPTLPDGTVINRRRPLVELRCNSIRVRGNAQWPCGYIVFVARAWLRQGVPSCPLCNQTMGAVDDLDAIDVEDWTEELSAARMGEETDA